MTFGFCLLLGPAFCGEPLLRDCHQAHGHPQPTSLIDSERNDQPNHAD
jgi:hypothetical protein